MRPQRRRYTLQDYLNRRVLVMLALGFSSGLPFLLVGNTFGYWLRDEGIALSAIGFLSWVGFAYTLKFLWAPLLDRMGAPGFAPLGRRRSWIALMQVVIAVSLIAMALAGTGHGLVQLGFCALLVAFASSTQDIAIDAWRIESARDPDELGLLTSGYTFGYRAALLMSEAVILPIAQRIGWNASYILYGCVMALVLGATLLASEPEHADKVMAEKEKSKPLWSLRGAFDAIIGPFIQFFRGAWRQGAADAGGDQPVPVGLFRERADVQPDVCRCRPDQGCGRGDARQLRPDRDFAGVALGGYLPMRLGLIPALLIGGVALAIGTMLYAIVPYAHDPLTFGAIMMADQFSIALAGITLVAYMSSLTSLGYTATQYALLSSAYALPGKFFKGFSGAVVEGLTPHIGLMNAYAAFFIGCGLIGLPALGLFMILMRKQAGQPAG